MTYDQRPAALAGIPIPLLGSDARRLARAAADLDTALIIRYVQTSVDDVGVVSTWEQLVQPVWQYLGSRSDAAEVHRAAEHLFVRAAMEALSAARPRPSPPSVVLACAGAEPQVSTWKRRSRLSRS
jgi:hypothetical protein